MPTMPERLAVVETRVSAIADDVAEIKAHVATLVTWHAEERGARRQRSLSMKQFGVGLTIVTFVINLVFKAVG